MRWVIHIGAPKTGSTAIQRFLCENRETLLARGIHFPAVSLRGFGHHDFAFLLGGGYPAWATPQSRPLRELAGELRTTIAAHDAQCVVLSSENFFIYPKPAALLALLKTAGVAASDQVNVVCYIRRQDEAQLSWYNQTVKAQGNSRSFWDTAETSWDLWDFDQRLSPWREVFGAEAIRLRDYGPFAAAPADVRTDFMDLLGETCRGLELAPPRENERINGDILALQRLVNRLPLKPQTKRRYHKQLIALTAAANGREVFNDEPLLTIEDRRRLLAGYAESNARVARTYFGREQLFDPLAPAPAESAPIAPRGITPAKLGFLARWLIARGAH